MNARRLLYWTDLESGRRARFRWIRRLAIAGGLAGLVAWRATLDPFAALGTWHAIITAAFAVAMIATSLAMFWRADAALLARLPISGHVLLQAAILRAGRTALLTGVTVALAAAPLLTRVPTEPLLRGLALIGTLTLITATFIPAAAATAALMVSGGQLASATATVAGVDTPERLPTTVLGALPGTASAFAVILAITVRWWIPTGESTAVGAAPTLLLVACGASLASLTLIARRSNGMSIALREVAALDRQRLAHLDVHPPRGLERVVARLLPRASSLVYDRTVRLMRRRYPMAWVVGFLAYLVAVPIAIWQPDDPLTWALGLAIATGAYSLSLAARLHRPPIDLPRHSTPISPAASAHARVAWMLLYIAVFAAAPTAIATIHVTGSGVLITLGIVALSTLAAAALAHRR